MIGERKEVEKNGGINARTLGRDRSKLRGKVHVWRIWDEGERWEQGRRIQNSTSFAYKINNPINTREKL